VKVTQDEIRQLAVEIDEFMDESDPYGYRMDDSGEFERSIAQCIAGIEAAIAAGDTDGNIRMFLEVAIVSSGGRYGFRERKRGRNLLNRLNDVLGLIEAGKEKCV